MNDTSNASDDTIISPDGVHDCVWAFTLRPPRVNSANRIEITSFINRLQNMNEQPLQANVPIRWSLQVVAGPDQNHRTIRVRWENRIYERYTVLLERFRRDQDISTEQPDNIDEARLPAADPGLIFDTPGRVSQTHCVQTTGYRYVSTTQRFVGLLLT